jgi:cyclohexyl-isocyanide hydratase
MDRRTFARSAAVAAAAAAFGNTAAAQGMNHEMMGHAAGPGMRTGRMALPVGPQLKPGEEPFRIAMIIFDAMTNQDFVGPHDAFSRVRVADIDVLSKTSAPVTTDSGGRVLADKTIAQARDQYDMLFIGGGPATARLMEDPEVIGFLQTRGPKAKYITSVCSGSLVLGAAGLLNGYKATTHWSAMEVLPLLGAVPTRQRVVFDRNRITGGGVTAGIDFGLAVIGKLWGDELAQVLQLGMEYDPQPPYDMGSPEKASAGIRAQGVQMMAMTTRNRMETAQRVKPKLG